MDQSPPANPYRGLAGQYVSLAQQKLVKSREKLIGLRSLAPTVYGDTGQFAKLGIQRHEARMRMAEIECGLWEGRALD